MSAVYRKYVNSSDLNSNNKPLTGFNTSVMTFPTVTTDVASNKRGSLSQPANLIIHLTSFLRKYTNRRNDVLIPV